MAKILRSKMKKLKLGVVKRLVQHHTAATQAPRVESMCASVSGGLCGDHARDVRMGDCSSKGRGR